MSTGKDQTRQNIKVPEPRKEYAMANISAIEERNPGFNQFLAKVPEKPVAVDQDIKIAGLNNPICLVVNGFSTRGVLDAAKKLGKTIHHVIVIEPDLGVFKATLSRFYCADLLKDPRVDFLVGISPEEIEPHLFKTMSSANKTTGPKGSFCQNPECINDPFRWKDDKETPARLINSVGNASRQVFLSMGCAADSFSRWEQTIRNEKNIHEKFRAKGLFNKFTDVPAIIVGGGPSLEEFIREAPKDIHKRSVIIACDATLPRLLKEGIKPHIVTRCERKLTKIFDWVTREDTKDVFYAAYPWTSPEFFELFDEGIMLFRDNGICGWTGYDPGSVNGGVSSANAAFELAYMLGCKNIFLTGIDLCFFDGKSHVSGTQVEFDISKSKPKWEKIPGNSGEVTTIPVWKRCLKEYEIGIMRHANEAKVWNLSLKGARINGAEPCKFEKLDTVCWKEFESIPEKIRENLETNKDSKREKYLEHKNETLQYLKEVKEDLEKLFLSLDDTMTTCLREEAKVISQLKAHTDPQAFWKNSEFLKRNMAEVFKEPVRQIDQFKQKHYNKKIFAQCLMDTCQLDVFTQENKAHGINNLYPVEHEGMKAYVTIHMILYRLYEYYAGMMINLFEKGPEKIEFRPTEGLSLEGLDNEATINPRMEIA